MALDLQEQEELENFKRAWHTWGRWVFGVLLVCAFVYLGYQLWQNHLVRQNAEAIAVLDQEFLPKIQAHDEEGALKALRRLQQDFGGTVPAAEATFMTAADFFERGQYDQAEKHLQWIKDKQRAPLIHALAIRRLATVYLQQKKYDEALRVLDEKVIKAFEPGILDLKGDIYHAQGKLKEAKEHYEEALKRMSPEDPFYEMVSAKAKR